MRSQRILKPSIRAKDSVSKSKEKPPLEWNPQKEKEFFENLGIKLGFRTLEEWYSLTYDQMKPWGDKILPLYNRSLSRALGNVYPHHKWEPWRFFFTPINYWRSLENRIQFLEWLGQKLGFKEMEDWYQITRKDVIRYGGAGFLKRYKGSPSALLSENYPQHSWLPWRFKRSPHHFWNRKENRVRIVEWLTKELGIKDLNMWYRVSVTQMKRLGSRSVFEYHPLFKLLLETYPQHSWNVEQLIKGPIKASQRELFEMVQKIFPYSKVLEDYELQDARISRFKKGLQLDIYLPLELLAFEYQGQQHYQDIYQLGPQHLNSERDEAKRKECEGMGIMLIEIPYWWQFDENSLRATIHASRPDLISPPKDGIPIPKTPLVPLKQQPTKNVTHPKES